MGFSYFQCTKIINLHCFDTPSYFQVVAAYMMCQTLNEKGYDVFSFSVPSGKEFLAIISLSAPVFISLMLKVEYNIFVIFVALYLE